MEKIYSSKIKKYNLFIFALILLVSLTISSNLLGQTQQTFTSSGTFTVPAGVTKITVECWGGGGNGGAPTSNGIAGGGGGGAYARKLVTVTPGNYTVNVGNSGLDSWFGTSLTVLAKGGSSVGAGSNLGAFGGTAAGSIGDVVFSGGNGANSGANYSGGGGSSGGNLANGNNASVSTNTGGAAPSGGGKGADGTTTKATIGNNGNVPGGGGSGAWRNGVVQTAGAGAAGQVIITYYTLTGTSVTTVCRNTAATVTLNSSASILKVGTYDVTYNVSGTNTATGNTATMTVSTAGTGIFSTAIFSIAGSTTVTITNLTSGIYSSSIGASNTATLTVGSAPKPTISAGSATTFCTGGNVVLSSSSASSYKWYQDGVLISGATNQTYTANVSAAYTVVTTDATGCTSPVSLATDVTVNTLPATPSITAGGPTTFCADGNLTLTSTTASTWQWYKGGVLISGATNQTYSPTISGTYTVVITNSFSCFSSASSGTPVVVNALPAPPTITAGSATTFCSGGTVTLTSDAATSYKWYDDNGIIAGATNQSFTTSLSGSYIVRVTNSFGCVNVSSAKSVTVNQLPIITSAAQTTSLCSSASAQTTSLAYTNTDNFPTSYSITWNAAAITAGFTNVTNVVLPVTPIPVSVPANVVASAYTGSLIVKNANGCASIPKSFTVTVKSSPDASNLSISAASGCEGTGAVITVNSTSIGNGVYNVKYDLTGFNASTNNTTTMTFSGNSATFTALALNAGSTTIKITEVSLVGCATTVTSNNTVTFTVNSLPAVPVISGPTKVCVGETITLSGNSGIGTWETSEPSIGTVTNLGVVSGLIGGSTIITYTTDPVNGCTNKNTQTITVNALPIVQGITGQTSLCVGTTSTLSDATPNGSWSSSDPSKATIDNTTGLTTAIAIGTTVITYTTPTDISTGCSNSTTITVTVSADPVVVAGADVTVCESTSPALITLSGASYSGGASSALWTIENGGGGALSGQSSGNSPSTVTYTPAANFYGTITLELTTNTVGTCGNASAIRLINITQKPTATPGAAITVCQNTTPSAITLVNALVGGSATTGTWSILSGGGILSDYTPVTDPANVTYTPASNFSGTVTLRMTTDAVGVCGATFADRTINVTAIPTADAGTQNSICQSATPGTFALAGASIGGGATNGAWSITLGTGTLSSTAPTATPASVTFQPTANFTGTIKLTLTTNTPVGCGFATAERIIDVTAASNVSTGGPDQLCQSSAPLALTLSPSTVGGGATTGRWAIVSGGGTLSSTNPETDPASVTYTPDINYTGAVSLLLTTNATGNCTAVSISRAINVTANNTVSAASSAPNPCINTSMTNITHTTTGATGIGSVTGLPASVTAVWASNEITISGTPSASGTFNYNIPLTGGCGTVSATGTITVSALTVGGTIADNQIICQNAQPANLVLSGNTGAVVKWQKSTTSTFTVPTTSDIFISNITLTGSTIGTLGVSTYFRAVVQSGNCTSSFSNVVLIAVNPPFTPVINISPASTVCQGQAITLSTGGFKTRDTILGGNFNDPDPAGWTGQKGNANNNNTNVDITWGYTNSGKSFGGNVYSSNGTSFMVTQGNVTSTITTPSFSTVGRTSLSLQWNQGYLFNGSGTGTVQISVDGTNWTTLATYNSSSPVVTTNLFTSNPITSINLNLYLGQPNVKVRFVFVGTGTTSTWALDNVDVVGPYQPATYSFPNSFTIINDTSATFTPPPGGPYTYSITTITGGCPSTTAFSVLVTVSPTTVAGTLPASVSVCATGNSTITLSGNTGGVTQWESSTSSGSSWTPITNSTITLTFSVVAQTTLYRALVKSGACSAAYSNATLAGLHNVWTGRFTTDWQTKGNWSDSLLPDLTCVDVLIPNVFNKPILSSGTATITNLLIQPSAALTISNTGLLQIGGIITKGVGGTFDVSAGTLDFNGLSPQSFSGNLFVGNVLKNLTVSNTNLTVSGTAVPLNITGELAFGAVSNSTLTTGDNIVLISTATATARVADITNNGSRSGNKFTGKVTVERYYPANRSWRLVTSPLSNTGTIFSNWQESAPSIYVPGRGIFITGPTPNALTNGLDTSFQNHYSMKGWRASDSTYVNIGDTRGATSLLSANASSAANIGYYLFVRGDRNRTPDNTVIPNTNVTTLSSKGNLQTGSQTFAAESVAGRYTLIGNPYASSIDFNKITKVNLNPKRFYVYDPLLGTIGLFVVMEENPVNSGLYKPTVQTTSTQRNFIQSSQAFFVEHDASNNAASITIEENNKSNDYNPLLFRPATPLSLTGSLRTNLLQLNISSSNLVVDGLLAEYDESFNAEVDIQDALKFTNINENLGLVRNGKILCVERRPLITADDTLFIRISRTTQRRYQLAFEPANLDPLLTAFLEDSYKGTKNVLSLTANSVYDFEVNGDAASAATDRFRIVFKKLETGPLPVTYKDIKAYQQQANIAVEWTVENEINISKYEVEKSSNGINFTKANTSMAVGFGQNSTNYIWIDINPVYGNNFYRIRSIGLDGKSDYSKAVLVKISKGVAGIAAYPNPVLNGTIGLAFTNMPGGIYKVRLFNSIGQTILNKQINHAMGTSLENIHPDYHLVGGIYKLEITTPDNTITTIKLLVK